MLQKLHRVVTPLVPKCLAHQFCTLFLNGKTVRTRQHVNPLSRRFEEPIHVPNWSQVLPNTTLPVHIDIGCARGKYLMELAQVKPEMNFIGIEIRQPVVQEAMENAAKSGLRNICFLHANMNFQMKRIMPSLLAAHKVGSISIFHPDPWMKKRHVKRRLVD